jgi:hypothetical protein
MQLHKIIHSNAVVISHSNARAISTAIHIEQQYPQQYNTGIPSNATSIHIAAIQHRCPQQYNSNIHGKRSVIS